MLILFLLLVGGKAYFGRQSSESKQMDFMDNGVGITGPDKTASATDEVSNANIGSARQENESLGGTIEGRIITPEHPEPQNSFIVSCVKGNDLLRYEYSELLSE